MMILYIGGALVVGFVIGILVGRKNKKGVETIVGQAKDKFNVK